MSKLRFVHVSDIHFGQESDGTLSVQEDVREALLRDCAAMAEKIGSADGILVTGDIAYSGKKEEYVRAAKWLDQLAETVGCEKIAVHVVPGNHDVDLSRIDYLVDMLHTNVRNVAAPKAQEILANLVPDAAASSPFLLKLGDYREFASQYASDFESVARPVSTKELRFPGGQYLRFRGITSVQVSDKSDKRGTMIIGNRQYIFPPRANTEYVVMTHHPLDWCKDRTEAQRYIHSRARVILQGHEHLPAIRKTEENNFEYLIVAAGATTPPENAEKEPYTYNWLEFDVVENHDRVDMVVTVHPRVFGQNAEFMPDFNRLDGQEQRSFVIRCPNFQRDAPLPPVAADAPSRVPMAVSDDRQHPGAQDEQFARLLFYFWRYLDWRERVGVLVNADVLPQTADQPIPQVLERSALAMAQRQHKLAPIWDAVMAKVPEAERQANPFSEGKR